MRYTQALQYLFRQLPMYQRIGPKALKKDLRNIIQLCEFLGNPHHDFKAVHIAGTNGKGTCAHLMAAALQSQGLKVGMYTSPHYKDFRERIKINGQMIPKKNVTSFVKKLRQQPEDLHPSFFEISVAMAFHHFNMQNVDIAIIETGLGGRLDSTNIIQPLLSLITNTSFDHQATLGNTLTEIAREKAGIIKSNVPLVIGEKNDETDRVFLEEAKRLHSRLIFAEDLFFCYEESSGLKQSHFKIQGKNQAMSLNFKAPLHGTFQSRNIVSSLASLKTLSEISDMSSFNAGQITHTWKNLYELTGYMGRWQILSMDPLIIVDSAHNLAAWQYVIQKLKASNRTNLHFVIGFSADKDLDEILSILPEKAFFYFCMGNVPRAMDAKKLARHAANFGLKGKAYTSPRHALAAAKRMASKDDLIFVGGSVFVVAEFL